MQRLRRIPGTADRERQENGKREDGQLHGEKTLTQRMHTVSLKDDVGRTGRPIVGARNEAGEIRRSRSQ